VLTRAARLTSSSAFAGAVRRGRRAGTPSLVLHMVEPDQDASASTGPVSGARVGFVVSKAVGPAVTRNLVKRRLRAVVRERLTVLPAGTVLVVRALPASATAPYASLARDFDAALERVTGRPSRSGRPRARSAAS
jgi:ribonuclease P protein component